jgi:hypothetical protein
MTAEKLLEDLDWDGYALSRSQKQKVPLLFPIPHPSLPLPPSSSLPAPSQSSPFPSLCFCRIFPSREIWREGKREREREREGETDDLALLQDRMHLFLTPHLSHPVCLQLSVEDQYGKDNLRREIESLMIEHRSVRNQAPRWFLPLFLFCSPS